MAVDDHSPAKGDAHLTIVAANEGDAHRTGSARPAV